jgi:hypothetical protein
MVDPIEEPRTLCNVGSFLAFFWIRGKDPQFKVVGTIPLPSSMVMLLDVAICGHKANKKGQVFFLTLDHFFLTLPLFFDLGSLFFDLGSLFFDLGSLFFNLTSFFRPWITFF